MEGYHCTRPCLTVALQTHGGQGSCAFSSPITAEPGESSQTSHYFPTVLPLTWIFYWQHLFLAQTDILLATFVPAQTDILLVTSVPGSDFRDKFVWQNHDDQWFQWVILLRFNDIFHKINRDGWLRQCAEEAQLTWSLSCPLPLLEITATKTATPTGKFESVLIAHVPCQTSHHHLRIRNASSSTSLPSEMWVTTHNSWCLSLTQSCTSA